MNIKIESLTNVTIDDMPRGGVVDVLFHAASAGDETLRAPMLDALTAWHESLMSKLQEKADVKLGMALTDKDTANDATLARLKGEHATALRAVQDVANGKLAEAAQAIAAATADGETKLAAQKTASDAAAAKASADYTAELDAADASHLDTIAQRDTLTTKLVEISATQMQLAAAGRDSEARLRATLAEAVTHLDAIKAVADRANQTADQRAADEKAARLAEAQALVAQLTSP